MIKKFGEIYINKYKSAIKEQISMLKPFIYLTLKNYKKCLEKYTKSGVFFSRDREYKILFSINEKFRSLDIELSEKDNPIYNWSYLI